jgi:histidinol phosphatase-like PHP family hydrolase
MLSNSEIAELLAVRAAGMKHPLSRAFKRASRSAILWPEEASAVVKAGKPLSVLPRIGPYLEKVVKEWLSGEEGVQERTPPVRENFIFRTDARKLLARNTSWPEELKGDLQMHTVWSDGSGTISEMAEAAMERSYEYIAITDHARGLKIAGGINENEIDEQVKEIDAVNRSLMMKRGNNFRVLRSIELNISATGEADLSTECLKKLDIVLGAAHSALRKSEDQTKRYISALHIRGLHILGHPRGRIYNFREGLNADWGRIFKEAASLDKAVEIDSYPDRQDLDTETLKLAKKAGCRISLGTDSHHPWQLEFIELGLAAATKAKIPRARILNFMPLDRLLTWANSIARK